MRTERSQLIHPHAPGCALRMLSGNPQHRCFPLQHSCSPPQAPSMGVRPYYSDTIHTLLCPRGICTAGPCASTRCRRYTAYIV
jgi:hypothetical protein